MRVPGSGRASPRKSRSTPAMMRSKEDLPAPLAPSTPILAPGKKARWMPLRISREGGTTFLRSRIVKMYSPAMGGQHNQKGVPAGTPSEVGVKKD